MSDPTESIVERIRSGDRGALEDLLCRELPALRAFVRLRTGPALRARESTSDLVQSVCRELLGKLELFHYGGEAGFRDWLYAAALRKIVHRAEHWTAQKRDIRLERVQGVGSEAGERDREVATIYGSFCTPSQHGIAGETLAAIETAFDQLPKDQREIIVMARIVGLDHASIAVRLGCTESTARKRLCRALAELAWVMGNGDETRSAPKADELES
jgi:RNA polymerase sigma factor (sigma-70 family)